MRNVHLLSIGVLLISMSVYSPVNLSAQQSQNNKDKNIKLRPTNPNNKNRPRMPAMITVDCWYGNGELSINFRNPEGECDITVTDTSTGFTVTDTFDSALPYTIYIGTPQSAVITLTTEEGNTYYGEIN